MPIPDTGLSRAARIGSGLLAVVTASALLAATRDATATTSRGPQSSRTDSGLVRTVTLLTGDRVRVAGDDSVVAVEPGAGRAALAFRTSHVDGHLSVVPSDAMALLAAGRLDPRLFDVTTLLADGYDDRRADLPLIVRAGTAKAAAPTAGVRVDRQLPGFGGLAVRQDRRQPGVFWRALTGGTGVSKVWLDGLRKPALDVSVPQIGAPAAWAAGYTGKGVTVAVLDTGVDDSHPDLAGKVAARANFTEDVEDGRDLAGHGTHVASTIAGDGSRYRGVAPDADLLDGKVCVIDGCADSWILAGMEWAAADQHAKVVNLSLGGYDAPGTDPLEESINTLSARYGTLFVVAAGNDPAPGSINSPAGADAALAVGAVDKSNQIAPFSSRGPRTGDEAIKPDITAPGVAITAARSKDSDLPGDAYTTLSGTSMATPHVAGAAALLIQRHPDWSGEQVKSALMGSAAPTAGAGTFEQGAGRVDVAAAIERSVTASPPSLSFGKQSWPHSDDPVLTKSVTYHNSGDAPVTLALAVDPESSGATAITVEPDAVTVPPGGDATATATADTRVAGPDGQLTGVLLATGSGQTIRTPVAVDKEVESYRVTVDSLGFDGAPAIGFPASLISWTTGAEYLVDRDSGTIRLPKGRYTVSGDILSTDPADPKVALLVQPALDLTGDRTVVLDARQAVASSITVPEPSASAHFALFGFLVDTPQGLVESGLFSNSFDLIRTAQVGDAAPVAGFSSNIVGVWAQDGSNSPYTYSVRYNQDGTMLAGFHHAVARSELATVRATYRAGNDAGMTGHWYATSRLPGQETHAAAVALPFTLPATVVRYFNSDGPVQWRSKVYETWDDGNGNGCYCGWTTDQWTHYTPGRTDPQTWGQAVFGPVLPEPGDLDTGVTRTGDSITADLPFYGDGAARSGNSGDAGSTSLFRDGVIVGSETAAGKGTFAVPPGAATYRLVAHSERGLPYALSTSTDAEWTFTSGHVDGGQPATLPLWTVRFSPKADRYNTVPAGKVVGLPVAAEPAPGADVGTVTGLGVEASFDDGATWSHVPVERGNALVRHPAGSGFVSLRATVEDSAGDSARLTIVHAYRYGKTVD